MSVIAQISSDFFAFKLCRIIYARFFEIDKFYKMRDYFYIYHNF